MSSTSTIVARDIGNILHVEINRPDVRNALRKEDKDALTEAIASASRSTDVRAVVLSGAGDRAFCAGTDISEMKRLAGDAALQMFDAERRLYASLLESPVPIVAAVEGAAIGAGCIVACCADIVVAGTGSFFQTPEVGLGLPAPMQTAILPQLVGLGWARRMLLTCERVDAETALARGLVTEIAASGTAFRRACELAEVIAGHPPIGVRTQKELIRAWISGEYHTSVQLSPYVAALALAQADEHLATPSDKRTRS